MCDESVLVVVVVVLVAAVFDIVVVFDLVAVVLTVNAKALGGISFAF
jgi:hypothetical protein